MVVFVLFFFVFQSNCIFRYQDLQAGHAEKTLIKFELSDFDENKSESEHMVKTQLVTNQTLTISLNKNSFRVNLSSKFELSDFDGHIIIVGSENHQKPSSSISKTSK